MWSGNYNDDLFLDETKVKAHYTKVKIATRYSKKFIKPINV
jgi:hypothetical protein